MSEQFHALTKIFNTAINAQLKAKNFVGNFKIASKVLPDLDVKSDHGMTVLGWIGINYPKVVIVTDESGFSG